MFKKQIGSLILAMVFLIMCVIQVSAHTDKKILLKSSEKIDKSNFLTEEAFYQTLAKEDGLSNDQIKLIQELGKQLQLASNNRVSADEKDKILQYYTQQINKTQDGHPLNGHVVSTDGIYASCQEGAVGTLRYGGRTTTRVTYHILENGGAYRQSATCNANSCNANHITNISNSYEYHLAVVSKGTPWVSYHNASCR